MRLQKLAPVTISRTNFKETYWSMAQQLAHVTSNGTAIRPGDLYASGTISGAEADAYGSLLELSWGGARRLRLPSGETRTFLEDGDEITLRGWCESGDVRIGFGEARGRVF
jgi:fumarylacetoacetase